MCGPEVGDVCPPLLQKWILDPAWPLAQTGSDDSSSCPVPEDPEPITVTMGSLWGEEPSGTAGGKGSNFQEENSPPRPTPEGQESCRGDITWSTADKPHHRPAGRPSDRRLVPRSWPWVTI